MSIIGPFSGYRAQPRYNTVCAPQTAEQRHDSTRFSGLWRGKNEKNALHVQQEQGVSDRFHRTVRTIFADLPAPVQQALRQFQANIIVCPTLPSGILRQAERRVGANSLAAVYTSGNKTIRIPEFRVVPGSGQQEANNAMPYKELAFTVIHEAGHAIDDYLGQPRLFGIPKPFSNSKEFNQVLKRDIANNKQHYKKYEKSLVDALKLESQPVEAFANCFAALLVNGESSETYQILFPNVTQYLKTNVLPQLDRSK